MELYCKRIEVAGSIRRKCEDVKDIEIVIIPEPSKLYDLKHFLDMFPKIIGNFPCKYTQRVLPEAIRLDLFVATEDNWGMIYSMRTGSASYSHNTLAKTWFKKGYHSKGGILYKGDQAFKIKEEDYLFFLLELPYKPPEKRI